MAWGGVMTMETMPQALRNVTLKALGIHIQSLRHRVAPLEDSISHKAVLQQEMDESIEARNWLEEREQS